MATSKVGPSVVRTWRRRYRPKTGIGVNQWAGCSAQRDLALLGVDVPEVLDDLERAALGPSDVHVHPHVVLSRHHLGGPARTLRDAGVVERGDDVVLLERSGLVDRGLPHLQGAVGAGARRARSEH